MSPITAAFLLLLSEPILALKTSPESSCSIVCSSVGDTASISSAIPSEICRPGGLQTEVGGEFKACVECLESSSSGSRNESDLGYFLQYLQTSIHTCILEPSPNPGEATTTCASDPGCMALSTTFGNETQTSLGQDGMWKYCATGRNNLDSCARCVKQDSNLLFFSNAITALLDACTTRPEPGALALATPLFPASPAPEAPPADDAAASPQQDNSPPLDRNTIIGIGVGVGVLFLGAIALFAIYFRRKYMFEKAPPTYGPRPPMQEPELPRFVPPAPTWKSEGYMSSTSTIVDTNENSGTLPAMHPAYNPRCVSRSSASTHSTTPLLPTRKQEAPDEYTTSLYVNAINDVSVSTPRILSPGERARLPTQSTPGFNTPPLSPGAMSNTSRRSPRRVPPIRSPPPRRGSAWSEASASASVSGSSSEDGRVPPPQRSRPQVPPIRIPAAKRVVQPVSGERM